MICGGLEACPLRNFRATRLSFEAVFRQKSLLNLELSLTQNSLTNTEATWEQDLGREEFEIVYLHPQNDMDYAFKLVSMETLVSMKSRVCHAGTGFQALLCNKLRLAWLAHSSSLTKLTI